MTRMAVVGAGAMGGALAAEASLAGLDVTVVDVSVPLIDRIRASGLEVRDSDGAPRIAHPQATADPTSVGPVDLVVVFVKAQHTRSAAATIAPLRGDGTVVVSLQNGWGNAAVLTEELGAVGLAYGVTYNSCSLVEPGVVVHSGRGETFVGPVDPGDGAGEVAASVLTAAGWATSVSADVRTEIWKKLILNAATLPTAALTGLAAGRLGASASMSPVVDAVADEASAVARALGLDIDPAERRARIAAVLAAAGPGKASMLQDAEARRKTEIEVINGAVSREGRATGTPTPLNDLLVSLIGGLEEGWNS